MSQMARRFPSGRYEEPSAGVFPLINVSEDKDAFYVRAELPGIKAEDLDISVTGESLSIGGERKIEVEEENVKYHRREREAGEFSRIVNLPSLIDTEKVEARCADGILEIVMPKSAATKPKQISIKSP
jgi:HSP20 family protein